MKKLIYIIIIAGLGAGGYWSYNYYIARTIEKAKEDAKVKDLFYTVKRGNMIIGVNQSGSINSSKKHKLSLEAAFNTKLLWIVDESKKVNAGDTLIKFETKDLKVRIDDYRMELENLEKELEIALEEKKILQSSNRAEKRKAEDSVSVANDALRQYYKFDRHKDKENYNLKVRKALKEMEEAEEAYENYKKELSQRSYKDKDDEVKSAQQLKSLLRKYENNRTNYKNTVLDRKVYKRYTQPKKHKELKNKLEQTKLNLERVKIQNASKVVQKDKSIKNLKKKIQKIQKKLEDHEGYLKKMVINAPVDGVVIYGDPDRRWGSIEIKIGMDVRRRQVLVTIPDMSNLIGAFDLPEQFRSKVKVGDKVIITPDAIKNVRVTGKISEISTLPIRQIFWDNNSPKIYKVKIALDQQSPKLVVGMSVTVEVISKVIKDTLYVPIEAVFEEGGKYFVYKQSLLKKPKETDVKIGDASDSYVQIIEGLKAGDKVYLYRPFSKKSKM